MRVDLGVDEESGVKRWAELIGPNEFTRALRFEIQQKCLPLFGAAEFGGEAGQFVVLMIIEDETIARIVTQWSFGDPPDKDPERVREIPDDAYDLLAAAAKPYVERLDFMKLDKVKTALRSGEPAGTSGSKDS
jgi:hypothetical protein